MNDTELHEHLDRASAGLEARLDPDSLWQRAERGRRRQRAYVAAGAAAAVAAVLTVVFTLPGADQDKPVGPVPTPSPTRYVDPLATRAPIPLLTDEQIQLVLNPDRISEIAWRDVATRSWDPIDTVPLGNDPVERAVVAHQSNPDQPDAVSVLGDDGRWRALDLTGIELPETNDEILGVTRMSLSPDGTRLALGQARSVVIVDLTTDGRETYETPQLGPSWTGRATAWSADGETVYVGSHHGPEGVDVAIDLMSGETKPVPFTISSSAFLADGHVIESYFEESQGSDLRRYDSYGTLELATEPESFSLGAMDDALIARGDRVAARTTQKTWLDPDERGRRSGVIVLDRDGHPEALLPVEGYQNNGGGGGVLGWLDDDTVLFQVYGGDGPGEISVLAWEVATGQLTRVADFTTAGGLSVAGSRL